MTLTPEEMNKIMEDSVGKLTDWQCRSLVHYMMGYMRWANDIELARSAYFNEIKRYSEITR